MADFFLSPRVVEWSRELSEVSFMRPLIQLKGSILMTYLSRAPNPNTAMLGVRISTYEFGVWAGDIHIQFIAETEV